MTRKAVDVAVIIPDVSPVPTIAHVGRVDLRSNAPALDDAAFPSSGSWLTIYCIANNHARFRRHQPHPNMRRSPRAVRLPRALTKLN